MKPKCIPLALALSWGFGHIFLTAYWTSPDQQPTLKSTDSNSNHKTSFSCYDLLPQLKTSFPWVTRLHLWNTLCCSIFPGTRSGSFSQSAFLLSPSLFLLLVFLYRRWLCLTLEIMVASCPPPPRHPEHYDQVSGAVLLKWKCNCVTPNNQTYSVSSWPTGEIFKLLDRTFKEVFSFWLLLVFLAVFPSIFPSLWTLNSLFLGPFWVITAYPSPSLCLLVLQLQLPASRFLYHYLHPVWPY